MSCPYHNLFNLHPLYLSEFSYELWVSASAATSTSTSSQTREAGSGDGGWGKTKPETHRHSNPHNNLEANRMAAKLLQMQIAFRHRSGRFPLRRVRALKS